MKPKRKTGLKKKVRKKTQKLVGKKIEETLTAPIVYSSAFLSALGKTKEKVEGMPFKKRFKKGIKFNKELFK